MSMGSRAPRCPMTGFNGATQGLRVQAAPRAVRHGGSRSRFLGGGVRCPGLRWRQRHREGRNGGHGTGRLELPRPLIAVRASGGSQADEPDGSALSEEELATLAKRVAEVKEREAGVVLGKIPFLVLDATLPGQRLTLQFPAEDTSRTFRAGTCLGPDASVGDKFGMLGLAPSSGQVLPLGTELEITAISELPSGETEVELTGIRRFKVQGQPWEEDGLALGNVEYCLSESPAEELTPEVLAASKALGALVEDWKALVVGGGFERQPDQIDLILSHLGPMPPPMEAAQRATWVCALVNPIPALGVAYEVRPALLMARNTAEMLEVATQGITTSIDRLKQGQRF